MRACQCCGDRVNFIGVPPLKINWAWLSWYRIWQQWQLLVLYDVSSSLDKERLGASTICVSLNLPPSKLGGNSCMFMSIPKKRYTPIQTNVSQNLVSLPLFLNPLYNVFWELTAINCSQVADWCDHSSRIICFTSLYQTVVFLLISSSKQTGAWKSTFLVSITLQLSRGPVVSSKLFQPPSFTVYARRNILHLFPLTVVSLSSSSPPRPEQSVVKIRQSVLWLALSRVLYPETRPWKRN